jgi:hypothetical protein
MVVAAGVALPAVGLNTAKKATTRRATAAVAPANALKRWAATNGGGPTAQSPTLAQALSVAANYDLILATKKSYAPYVAQMRQMNPSLKIVAYLNGTYAQSNEGGLYPEPWYARDANGAKVRSKKFGNYLMDPTNAGWIQSRTQTCADYATQAGYDGCYLDMLGNATVGKNYVTAPPVNPATHAAWTSPGWIGATSRLGASVQAANWSMLVVGNGLGNGNQYFDPASGPSSALLNGLAGGNAQGWIRSESDAITDFRTAKVWKRDVDMLGDAAKRGRFVMAMTKTDNPGTPAQLQQVHRYALASFLLGTDGTQYFYFSPNGNDDGVNAPDTPDDHVNPGMPLTSYTAQANGAYVRPYSNGYVAVNPNTAPVTVNLGATYVDLDGNSASQVTLQPHTGMVFTKNPSSPAPSPGVTTTTTAKPQTTSTTKPRTTPTTVCPRQPRATAPGSPVGRGVNGKPGAPGRNALMAASTATTSSTAVAVKAAASPPLNQRPARTPCRPRPSP